MELLIRLRLALTCGYGRWMPLLTMVLLLWQRSPLARTLHCHRTLWVSPWAKVAKWSTAAVAVNGLHSVTGASNATEIAPVFPATNPATTPSGESFGWVWRTAGGKSDRYEVKGLPEGLTYDGKVTGGLSGISGAPEVFGSYAIEIVGWRGEESTETYILTLEVTPEEGHGTFDHWADTHGLTEGRRSQESDPDKDGFSNAIEYAFNLDPNAPTIVAQAGEQVTVPQLVEENDRALQIAYVRRKPLPDATINYTPQVSVDFVEWEDAKATENVVDIDATWEGVLLQIPRASTEQRYFRVKVDF